MVGVVGAALRGFGRALKAARKGIKKTKNLSPEGLDYPVIKSVDPKVHKTKKPPVGTFKSWPSEVIRTTTNILKGKK